MDHAAGGDPVVTPYPPSGAIDGGTALVIPAPPAPMVPVAIGIILGIVADESLHLSAAVYLALGITGAAALWHFAGRHHLHALAIITATAAALGAIRHAASDRLTGADDVSHVAAPDPRLTELRGRVLDHPRITPDDVAVYRRPCRTQFNLDVMNMPGATEDIPLSGVVAVSVRDAALDLSVGDVVRISGWLSRPGGPRNPGGYDWRRHLHRQGIHARLTCDHLESVRIESVAASHGIADRLRDLRSFFRGRLLDGAFDESDEAGGIVAAVVLGERSAVGRAMNEVFRRTGCTHFLAASGMNVAWLGLLVVAMTWTLNLHYRLSAILTAATLILYAILAEPEPSILRAVVIGLLACAGVYLRGGPNSLNWLATSAVVLLLIDPFNLFRPAFQLSFIAVAAVVHLAPRIIESWHALITDVQMQSGSAVAGLSLSDEAGEDSRLQRVARWILRSIGLATAVSLSAWIAAAPIVAYTFDQFTPLGWLWTQLLLIPAFLATLVGFSKLIIDLLFPSAAMVTGPLLAMTTNWLTGWATAFSRTPFTIVRGNSPSLAWVIAAYAWLIIWIWRPTLFRRRWIAATTAMLLIVWWWVPARWSRIDRGSLLVWSMAVGDGLGTLIELPDGRAIIYDFGTRSGFDAGQIARDVLRDRGITRIAAVIVSHTDVDHLSAIEAISDECQIDRLLITDHFESQAREHVPARRMLQTLRDQGIAFETLPAPGRIDGLGDVEAELLWPPHRSTQTFLGSNDTSVVLRLAWQGRSILLTGDVDEVAMSALIKRGGLKSDVMALPHHGAVEGTTPAFIRAVDAETVIRSTGQRRELTTNGIDTLCRPARYLSTADVGCVKAKLSQSGVKIETPFSP